MPDAVSRGRELAALNGSSHSSVRSRSCRRAQREHGAADDSVIANHARENGFCLLTRDKDFGDIRNYPPADYAGIIVLDLPDETVAADVLRMLESFLSRKEWLDRLQGRLAIVQPGRVRFRPA